MIKIASRILFMALLASAAPASAQEVYAIYASGEKPDRMIVYADRHVRDRTSMDAIFGPERIMQLEIDIVFEAPEKPRWTEMTLQFPCKQETTAEIMDRINKKKRKAVPTAPDIPAKFLIVGGTEYITRWKERAIGPEGWSPITAELFAQVGKFACNQAGVQEAIMIEYDSGKLNPARLRKNLTPLGLQDIFVVHGEWSIGSALYDMTWEKFWTDGTPPKQESTGRKLTAEEIVARDKKFEEYRKQSADLASQTAAYAQPKIDDLNAQSAFTAQAAKIRGKRKVSKLESAAISAWQGRQEYDVALAMGAANVTDMEGLRFLSYMQDKEVSIPGVGTDAFGDPVGSLDSYARCDVKFVLAKDQTGTARVADVTIAASGNDLSYSNYICDGFVKAPQN
jgi:hypothetical protein